MSGAYGCEAGRDQAEEPRERHEGSIHPELEGTLQSLLGHEG